MLTIKTWLHEIGLKQPIEECPAWPPDLYALAGTLIRRSGAYLKVFERRGSAEYLTGIEQEAATWRRRIDEITARNVIAADLQSARVPDVVNDWRKLIDSQHTPISEIYASKDLAEALIRLTVIADKASVGIGINWNRPADANPTPSNFLSIAEEALYRNKLQSFCLEVPSDVLCVLAKQHTPLRGATFRSLSHHLGRVTGLSLGDGVPNFAGRGVMITQIGRKPPVIRAQCCCTVVSNSNSPWEDVMCA